jgi:hypothetical protein
MFCKPVINESSKTTGHTTCRHSSPSLLSFSPTCATLPAHHSATRQSPTRLIIESCHRCRSVTFCKSAHNTLAFLPFLVVISPTPATLAAHSSHASSPRQRNMPVTNQADPRRSVTFCKWVSHRQAVGPSVPCSHDIGPGIRAAAAPSPFPTDPPLPSPHTISASLPTPRFTASAALHDPKRRHGAR